MIKVYYSNELYHHGTKGQKWGIRRYQNADGSLTAEGKARRAAQQKKEKVKAAKKKAKQAKRDERIGKLKAMVSDAKARHEAREKIKRDNTKIVREKDMSKYSTEELIEKTKRLNAENNYMNAVNLNNKLNPVKVSLGKRILNGLKEQTVAAVSEYAKDTYKNWVKDQLKNMLTQDNNKPKSQPQQQKQKQENNNKEENKSTNGGSDLNKKAHSLVDKYLK